MRFIALAGLSLLALCTGALGQRIPEKVDPITYVSPSGHYKLRINPDDAYATKGGKYRLLLDNKIVWERHFPFALLKAGITDDGTFGGYACTDGGSEGQIVVAVGDRDGKLRLKETHTRRPTRVEHGQPLPSPGGLLFNAENDRMIVRVYDPDVNKGREQWWTYRLSDGRPQAKLDPELPMPTEATWIIEARPVPGTPLTLLSWWHYDEKPGAILTLVDADAKPVWRLELKGDYDGGKDEYLSATKTSEFQRLGSILSVADRRFTIRRVRDKQSAAYSVSQIGGSWKVRESSRQPYSPPAIPKNSNPLVRAISLSLQRKWKIPLSATNRSPIENVEDFELTDGRRIAVLRGGKAPAVIVTDQDGSKAQVVPLPVVKEIDGGESCLAGLGKNRFLVTKTKSYRPSSTLAWIIDTGSRRVASLPIPGQMRIKAVAAFADGGFAALQTEDHAYNTTERLAIYDRKGKLTWQSDGDGGYRGEASELLSPEDLAINPQGQIVVLDNITHALQFFSRQGKYLKSILLDKVWKAKPEYPTQIRCVGSGFLVWDMSVAYRLDSAGKILDKISPRLANSKPLNSRFDPQVDAKGDIWISEGEALYRLDKKGVVAKVVGRVTTQSGLHQIGDLTVALDGTVYARDAHSDEVQAFQFDGKRRIVIAPLRKDLKDSQFSFGASVFTDDKGRIYVDYDGVNWVRFSAFGKRELEFSPKWEHGGPPPALWKKGWWWMGARLIDDQGKVVTTVERLPNDDWLSWPSVPNSVAPNGHLAILEFGDTRLRPRKARVGFYSPTGVGETTAEMQWDPKGLYQFAYDGRLIYFPRERDLIAFDKTGKPLWRFALPNRKEANWSVFPSRGGLAVFDGIDTVYWYRLPG